MATTTAEPVNFRRIPLQPDILTSRRVLILEPDDRVADVLFATFERNGWQAARMLPESLDTAGLPPSHVVLGIDSATPRLSLLREIRALYPQAVVIVTLAYLSIPTVVDVIRLGAHNCLAKPFDPQEVLVLATGGTPTDMNAAALPSLAKIEWEYMTRVLALQGGNISQSARILGIRRTTLQRKLKKYPPTR